MGTLNLIIIVMYPWPPGLLEQNTKYSVVVNNDYSYKHYHDRS